MLPNGARIEVADSLHNEFGTFVNIKITASQDDYEWNELHPEGVGLCGKLTQSQGDDLIKRDGSVAGSDDEFITNWM